LGAAAASVSTVRGAVEADRLGTTLMHEHVFVLNAEVQQNRTDWDEDERVADAVAKLNEAAALGVETIVDVTVLGLGRYIPRLQRIAAASCRSSSPPASTPTATCRSGSTSAARPEARGTGGVPPTTAA
jgi:hypothetical protein